MLSEKKKDDVRSRLKRIAGQVSGVERMIDEERYCMDIVTQVSAVCAALRTVEEIVMENHLNTCVADAIRSSDRTEQQEKIDEVMTFIKRMRKRA